MAAIERTAEEATNPGAALELLLTRQSVGPKHLRAPGPTDEQLWLAALAALRAPDHEKLVPFRFALITEQTRPALAALFAEFARKEGKPEADIVIERERAMRAPTLLAVIARIDAGHALVPAHEQWLAAGGALSNFVTALHMMGYGAKVVSGRKARDPDVVRAFCGPGESLIGWIAAGTPDRTLHPRYKDNPDSVLSDWTPA